MTQQYAMQMQNTLLGVFIQPTALSLNTGHIGVSISLRQISLGNGTLTSVSHGLGEGSMSFKIVVGPALGTPCNELIYVRIE